MSIELRIVDPGNPGRSGWHRIDDYAGAEYYSLNGNIKAVFFTDIPIGVPSPQMQQPDDWSCGPYALGIALNSNPESARNWLLTRGLITSAYGTEYEGMCSYVKANGYGSSWSGWYNRQMHPAIYDKIVSHMQAGKKVILLMGGLLTGSGSGGPCRNSAWSQRGHYVTAAEIRINGKTATTTTTSSSNKITVDGVWGKGTTTKAQQVFKTTVDGIVSRQNVNMKPYLKNCHTSSWEFVSPSKVGSGSELIKAIQRKIGCTADGIFGNYTAFSLQKFLGCTPDGYIGPDTVKAFQNWLNKQ